MKLLIPLRCRDSAKILKMKNILDGTSQRHYLKKEIVEIMRRHSRSCKLSKLREMETPA